MTDTVFWIIIFIFSLMFLIKSSDYFAKSAEKIGLTLGISQFVIGVTIVSVGTSLPELIASIFAVLEHSPEIVGGNVVGSNIANIFLILACGAIFSKNKLRIEKNLLPVDLPMMIGSAMFLALTVYDDHLFSRWEAFLFVAAILVYIFYNISEGREESKNNRLANNKNDQKISAIDSKSDRSVDNSKHWAGTITTLVISGIVLFFSAKYTIQSIVAISEAFNIGTEIIALTVVALGTSLPELAVTYSAAKSGNGGIVVGNVLGSNIFNTFAVMGVPGLIQALPFPATLLSPGLVIMIIATALFLVVTVDKVIGRWEGFMFILFYFYFIGKTVMPLI